MTAPGSTASCIYPLKSPRPMVPVVFQFFPNGTSQSALTVEDYGSGRVASVARTSNAGEYLVTMAHSYYKAGPITPVLSMTTLATAALLEASVATVSNEATATALTFLVRVRGITNTAAATVVLDDIDLNSLPPDAQFDIVDVGTTTVVDAALIEANDSTLGTAINALNAAVETLSTSAGEPAFAGYDMAAAAGNYIKVTAWLFSSSVPA